METTSICKNDISRDWFVIDAEGQTLGRLASEVAQIIRGKKKTYFIWKSRTLFGHIF